MRFGLERIRKLVSALGMPQHRFASVHVVGTNGKSSVTEMTAALLEAHGLRTGAYLSPHDERWAERIRIAGAEIAPPDFGAAVERVAQAVAAVDRTLDPGDAVTQFEADTAAAFVALAAARVDAAVIEAGLGGRLDATNVLPSRVTVLTSIGLEHTEWLGDTEIEIAAEKLAVLRDHTKLVLGPVSAPVEELARRSAAERRCELVAVRDLAPGVAPATEAPYLRRNFAVALAAAEALLGPLDRGARRRGRRAALELPGRAQMLAAAPAADPRRRAQPGRGAGARRGARAARRRAPGDRLPGCARRQGRRRDRWTRSAPRLAGLVATEIPAELLARAARPGARASGGGGAGGGGPRGRARLGARGGRDPVAAIALARARAEELDGAVLVTGSHYLLRYATG